MSESTTGALPQAAVFPFIVGCGRSGTTLVRAILDSHPEMLIPAETKFILAMARRRRRYEAPAGFRLSPFFNDLPRLMSVQRGLGIPWPELLRDFQNAPPVDYPDAVRRLFALAARLAGKTRYGNKTPVHVLRIRRMASLFPESRFVHVIRDGRDVALSFFDVEFGPDTVEGAALRWKRYVSRGRHAGRELGAGRYLEVRYEDLLDEPEEVVGSLCRFLSLSYDEAMLRYFERSDEIVGRIRQSQYHTRLSLPPTKGLRNWRTHMAARDVARFEALAGGLLSDLGYERATPRVHPGVAAAARARAVGDGARRIVQALNRRAPWTRHVWREDP